MINIFNPVAVVLLSWLPNQTASTGSYTVVTFQNSLKKNPLQYPWLLLTGSMWTK